MPEDFSLTSGAPGPFTFINLGLFRCAHVLRPSMHAYTILTTSRLFQISDRHTDTRSHRTSSSHHLRRAYNQFINQFTAFCPHDGVSAVLCSDAYSMLNTAPKIFFSYWVLRELYIKRWRRLSCLFRRRFKAAPAHARTSDFLDAYTSFHRRDCDKSPSATSPFFTQLLALAYLRLRRCGSIISLNGK